MVGSETGPLSQFGPESLHENARYDQKHERKRNLPANEQIATPEPPRVYDRNHVRRSVLDLRLVLEFP